MLFYYGQMEVWKLIPNQSKQDTPIWSRYSILIVQILAWEEIFQTEIFWSSDNYFYCYSIYGPIGVLKKVILNKSKQDTWIWSMYIILIVQILASKEIFQTEIFWSSDNYFYCYSIYGQIGVLKRLFSRKASKIHEFEAYTAF